MYRSCHQRPIVTAMPVPEEKPIHQKSLDVHAAVVGAGLRASRHIATKSTA